MRVNALPENHADLQSLVRAVSLHLDIRHPNVLGLAVSCSQAAGDPRRSLPSFSDRTNNFSCPKMGSWHVLLVMVPCLFVRDVLSASKLNCSLQGHLVRERHNLKPRSDIVYLSRDGRCGFWLDQVPTKVGTFPSAAKLQTNLSTLRTEGSLVGKGEGQERSHLRPVLLLWFFGTEYIAWRLKATWCCRKRLPF